MPSFSSISPGLIHDEPSFFPVNCLTIADFCVTEDTKNLPGSTCLGKNLPDTGDLSWTVPLPCLAWSEALSSVHHIMNWEQYICLQKKLKWSLSCCSLDQVTGSAWAEATGIYCTHHDRDWHYQVPLGSLLSRLPKKPAARIKARVRAREGEPAQVSLEIIPASRRCAMSRCTGSVGTGATQQFTCLVICQTQSMNCRKTGERSASAWFLSPWPTLWNSRTKNTSHPGLHGETAGVCSQSPKPLPTALKTSNESWYCFVHISG